MNFNQIIPCRESSGARKWKERKRDWKNWLEIFDSIHFSIDVEDPCYEKEKSTREIKWGTQIVGANNRSLLNLSLYFGLGKIAWETKWYGKKKLQQEKKSKFLEGWFIVMEVDYRCFSPFFFSFSFSDSLNLLLFWLCGWKWVAKKPGLGRNGDL